jgi:hypothetical protein
MSSALRNAAETTAHALAGLVDGARDRIEELPPIARARRKHHRTRWSVVGIVGLVAVVLIARRMRHVDRLEPTIAHLDEPSLAAS